jgi:very-short-patch-repair endonuclease
MVVAATVVAMFTGVFKDRTRARAYTTQAPNDVLARLLQSKSLRPHVFVRSSEVGPFIVDHVCHAQALVVELSRGRLEESEPRRRARIDFINELGYRVLQVTRQDVLNHPDRVLAQVRAALR